jgi:hypothetical protein
MTTSHKCKYGYHATCSLGGCRCQCHATGPDVLAIAVADAAASSDTGGDGGGCGGE